MFGDKIKDLRKSNNMTQSELASKVDTDSTTISRWETNRVQPGQKYIYKLAKALSTTADYLMNDDAVTPVTLENQNTETETVGEKTEGTLPYTRTMESEKLNRGMLSYTLKDGTRIELPPIKASYDFLKEMALSASKIALL